MRRRLVLGTAALLSALAGWGSAPAKPAAAQTGPAFSPPAAGTRRYALSLGESVIQPQVLSHPPPVYPPALLAQRLPPIDIPVQLAVDGEGRVYRVSVGGEATADAVRQVLIAAIRAATAHWRFSPRVVNHLAADAAGRPHRVDSERLPFSRFFVFHFQQRDGRPQTGDTAVP